MARFECWPPWLFLIAFPQFLVACSTSECTTNAGRWFTVYSCLGIIYLLNKQTKLGFYALLHTHTGLMTCLPSIVTKLNYCFWSQEAYCVPAVLWWQMWNSIFFIVILLQITILGGSSGFDSADCTPHDDFGKARLHKCMYVSFISFTCCRCGYWGFGLYPRSLAFSMLVGYKYHQTE
jgi:hypothetical protein